MKTLKEVARALNISERKASQIKAKIEYQEYRSVPSWMIWGTGNKKNYRIEIFRKYL